MRVPTTAGIHALKASIYHGDPCERPSLSASIAHTLITSSPIHAWTQHPRLNPDYLPEEAEHFDIGSAAHALLLEGQNGVEIVDAKDWRTAAAQDARAEARLNGRFPLLAKQWDDVQAMVAAALIQLRGVNVNPQPFTDGQPEQTLIWEDPDYGVTCRARLDWLHTDYAIIDDYKTAGNANPEAWSRRLFDQGCDVQAAFYLRGLAVLTGVDADWRWCVQEKKPPYALTVMALAPPALELAQAKVEHALKLWRQCLEAGVWPGYPRDICFADLPPYEEARWLQKEEREYA
jgi:hypothetical protein